MKRTVIVIFLLFLFLFASNSYCKRQLNYNERIFDFGHVGIDFKVYHTFKLFNDGKTVFNVDSMDVSCDCTSVIKSGSILQPNDTINFELEFETKNYYGPTTKAFKIFTDYGALPVHEFYYKATVGQWFNGIKPNPISLFFLPGNNSKKVSFPNPTYKNLEIENILAYDTIITVNILNKSAKKNQAIVVEIVPSSLLSTGTYYTNFTVSLIAEPSQNQIILTIPIKIVKY